MLFFLTLLIFQISFFVFLKIPKLKPDFSYKIFNVTSAKQMEKLFFILHNGKRATMIFHNYPKSYFQR
jgi:hypothetical protein